MLVETVIDVHVPSYGEHGQCAQKKYISLFPLLAQCRSEMLFFFFRPYTPSLRVCMERRRKKHSHSCTVPGVGRGKCIFSGRIVRFLHIGVKILPSKSIIFLQDFSFSVEPDKFRQSFPLDNFSWNFMVYFYC